MEKGLELMAEDGILKEIELFTLAHHCPLPRWKVWFTSPLPVIFGYVAIPVDFDPSIIESFPANSLPTGWQDEPPLPRPRPLATRG